MGRHARPRKPKDVEAIPDPTGADDVEEDAAPEVRKKRGRPPKVKVDVQLPEDVQRLIALAPLIVAQAAAYRAAGLVLAYPPEAMDGCVIAFKEWLGSYDFKLTPGWALLASYAVALGAAGVAAAPAQPAPKEKPVEQSAAPPTTTTAAATPDPLENAREVHGPSVVTPNGAPPHATDTSSAPGSVATPA